MLVLCISITATSMKALVLAEGITLGLFENAFLKSVAFLLQLGLTFIWMLAYILNLAVLPE